MIAALLLSLSLHTHPALANRITCYGHRPTHCVKTPVLRARHTAYGSWTKHGIRFIHGKWRAVTVTFPILRASYQVPMLVTWYDDSGAMADGTWTYQGAAACGYDLPFNARLKVPGVPGVLTCHDRIGKIQWHHVDVWLPNAYAASLLGLGMDYRMVRVYA